MTSHKRIPVILSWLGLIALTACNLSAGQNLSPVDQAATVVAMTLKAQGLPTSGGPGSTPFASPAAATPTTKPSLFIHNDNAHCKSGPGADFKVISTYNNGTTVDLIAKDTADGYWLVKDPVTGESCWVQVQDATPGGSFDLLPEVTPQAVAQSVPGRPGRGNWNFSCDNSSLTTILAWSAPSGTVNGYRVYRLGNQIADLQSTQTSYTETINFTYGSSMSYGVEAYNDAGPSSQVTWNFTCP